MGREHPVCIHLLVKLEGTLETLVIEKLGNAALVQESAREGILMPKRYLGEAILENFFGFLVFPSLQ